MAETKQISWSAETVEQLNRYQRGGYMHPFTCPTNHDGDRDLVATESGWVCPFPGCSYTQTTYHAHMVDREWMDRQDAFWAKWGVRGKGE